MEKVFNHKEEDDVAAVQRLTEGRGVDYVYDQVAGPAFCRQFDMLATYGQIILYNYLGGYPEDKEIVHILQSRCEGCYGIRYFSIHVHDTDPAGFRKVKEEVLGLIASGAFTAADLQGAPAFGGARGSRDDRLRRSAGQAGAAPGSLERDPRPLESRFAPVVCRDGELGDFTGGLAANVRHGAHLAPETHVLLEILLLDRGRTVRHPTPVA